MDITVDSLTLENHIQLANKIFNYLNSTGVDISDSQLFELPYGYRNYGLIKIKLFGKAIDFIIICKVRNVMQPESFIPTNDVIDDSKTRDVTVNAIYYNVRENSIQDPLNGIESLKNGKLVAPYIAPDILTKNLFRLLRSSIKYSMKFEDELKNYILNNLVLVDVYIFILILGIYE